ncbi:hypothetical protein [Acidihalobacter prosperus]|uniref:Uncharacterized protein n=1 Tax=Acidihalobacter prosperus TaxID=160660 RepID=A0A1A6C6E5_9GAMM|nr:hypothetical protein [Acidihalobacter prosperus]OBS10110.1 hypothetical protein Thpro_021160 [Acidihalobacter prosperus]
MPREEALAYPRKVTYNFSQWGADQPVSLFVDGVRHFGVLKAGRGEPPYQVVLSEVFEHGASRRIAPRTLELHDLGDLHFLHQHGH